MKLWPTSEPTWAEAILMTALCLFVLYGLLQF